MKRLLYILTGLAICMSAYAQNDRGTMNDVGRIALTPVIVNESKVPVHARQVLTNKLKQIVTKNGLAASAPSPRFMITANTDLLAKEVTATAPVMTVVEVATTLYIGDAKTGNLFGSYICEASKGVGTNEHKAYIEVLKRLNVNDPGIQAFVADAKNKIVEYYNTQIEFMLAEAESLAGTEKYDEAITLLSEVPDVCKDAHAKAMTKISEIYQRRLDKEGTALLNEAVAQWKVAKNLENAEYAVYLLSKIHPLSSASAEGKQLVNEIEAHFAAVAQREQEERERERAFRLQKYADSLQAAQDQRMLDHEISLKKIETTPALSASDAAKADAAIYDVVVAPSHSAANVVKAVADPIELLSKVATWVL